MRILALALVLVAADSQYGFSNDRLSQHAFDALTNGFWVPQPTKELKALPVDARATAVTSLGKAVRAVVESQAFRERYKKYVTEQRAEKPKPKRSHADVLAEVKKQIAEQKAQTDKSLAQMDPATRKQVEESMKSAYDAQLQMYQDKEMVETMETQRVLAEQQSYDESLARYPDDLNVKLRDVLKNFLTDTEGVDYSAKTAPKGDKLKFVNTAFESKSDLWKKAYRAGKPATDAARGFAREWLAALK